MKRLLLVLVLIGCACAQEIRLTQVASGFTFPTDIQSALDGSGRLFVVQQNGLIRIVRDATVVSQPFLDIRSKTRVDSERGLLGLAFPPDFGSKQRFYVDYTDLNGDTVIAQYRVSSNSDVADASSEVVLLHIAQPFANHNGGQVRFGPDGYLYIAMGDGGSGGDPMNNGQSLGTLLGKLLRIDVEGDPGRVRIPPDNPFVNRAGARGEIWAYGLRNPWRFSFDPATNDLWIADVGQEAWEEVDLQPAPSSGGQNYGWNITEGLHCFRPNCSFDGLVRPVSEYSHAEGCSITGGFVYRGRGSPGLRGAYVFGDYCSGTIWGLERQGNAWTRRVLLTSRMAISTFGQDGAGELYVADHSAGVIYHIEGSAAPRLTAAGVVNAASFRPGLVPGSLATLFAAGLLSDPGAIAADRIPLPAMLGGVAVTVNGIAAPILSVANVNGQEQASFQVPFEIAGQKSVAIAVSRSGVSSAAVDVPVADISPGIYTLDGTQAVVVHNADFTLATRERPLVPGEFAFFYAAGLGAVMDEPPTGAAASGPARVAADVSVMLAGTRCAVPYAGLAPGLVGVYQVNFGVHSGIASGVQDLVMTADGVVSPVVKVMVR